MTTEGNCPTNPARRRLLARLGLGLAVAYAAPVLVQVGEARASDWSGGSGFSGGRRWGRGSGSWSRGSISRGSYGSGHHRRRRHRDVYFGRPPYDDDGGIIIEIFGVIR